MIGRTITKPSGLRTERVNETTVHDADNSVDGDSPKSQVLKISHLCLGQRQEYQLTPVAFCKALHRDKIDQGLDKAMQY